MMAAIVVSNLQTAICAFGQDVNVMKPGKIIARTHWTRNIVTYLLKQIPSVMAKITMSRASMMEEIAVLETIQPAIFVLEANASVILPKHTIVIHRFLSRIKNYH